MPIIIFEVGDDDRVISGNLTEEGGLPIALSDNQLMQLTRVLKGDVGTIGGRGAHSIIIDDPLNAKDIASMAQAAHGAVTEMAKPVVTDRSNMPTPFAKKPPIGGGKLAMSCLGMRNAIDSLGQLAPLQVVPDPSKAAMQLMTRIMHAMSGKTVTGKTATWLTQEINKHGGTIDTPPTDAIKGVRIVLTHANTHTEMLDVTYIT